MNRIHVLCMFAQPNLLFTDDMNLHLLNFGSIRLYVIIRFYLLTKKSENPRFYRIINSFGLSIGKMTYKIFFTGNQFKISLCILIAFIMVGLGNFIRFEEESLFNGFLDVVYYLFITLTTIGYGDVVPKTGQDRLVVCFVTISGTFLISIMIVTVLKEFSFTKL
jgi:hypothetical protein